MVYQGDPEIIHQKEFKTPIYKFKTTSLSLVEDEVYEPIEDEEGAVRLIWKDRYEATTIFTIYADIAACKAHALPISHYKLTFNYDPSNERGNIVDQAFLALLEDDKDGGVFLDT